MPSTPTASLTSVSALRMFAGVDAERLESVLADCDEHAYATGTTLLRPGESNDSIYLVLECDLLVRIGEGHFAIGPGECFGEMSVVDGRKVSALVVAVKPTRLVVVPGAVFWSA